MRRPALAFALLVALAFVTLFVDSTSGQVNFTPGWGKRSGLEPPCKPSMESIMYLYKMIQGEAQKLVDCDKYTN